MKPSYKIVTTRRFQDQVLQLSKEVYQQLKLRVPLLETNPRHPSLRTHEVKHSTGDFGGKIFEAYVSKKYRMTWEYGPSRGEIILRNVDNHDECLNHP